MKHPYIEAVDDPFLVPFDGDFDIDKSSTEPPQGSSTGKEAKKKLAKLVDELSDYQRILYAHDRRSVLLVFQAMDAAGKDSTIRAVMSGINPSGFQVYSFKQPSHEELDHDFLWRTSCRLPERGRIGIFNRSYYEEVLVVRVHPEYLDAQRLPKSPDKKHFWQQRMESIQDHEKHLARNGTVILKFWLNVSRDEQKRRFLDRIDKREKNWKFSSSDIEERMLWPAYMSAYEDMLRNTSRPWAPWYAIPADDKPFMRLRVADILTATFQRMNLSYPKLDPKERSRLAEMKDLLDESQ